MKQFFTLFAGLAMMPMSLLAQDAVDMSFVFVDKQGNVLADGATVTRSTVTVDELTEAEMISSEISVRNVSGASTDFIKIYYSIEQMDNGIYQICFPSTCNTQDEEGAYETSPGMLIGTEQDIRSEWLPDEDGKCTVVLDLEIMTRTGSFPNITYQHKAYGPSLTINFIKGAQPGPEPLKGDVNGDGELNIGDVNVLINMILSGEISNTGDVDGDGEIGISDVNALIDLILNYKVN